MVSTWMGDHSSVKWIQYIVKNTVTSQEWRNGGPTVKTPEAKKNINKLDVKIFTMVDLKGQCHENFDPFWVKICKKKFVFLKISMKNVCLRCR